MKNLFLKLFAIILLAGFFHACNETLVDEPAADDLELKSAQQGKKSYIVQIDDAQLNLDLPNQKGYEKREEAIERAASVILERSNIPDAVVEHIYNTALKGFSVQIPPAQLPQLENDPAVVFIEEDKVVTLIEPLTLSSDGDISAQAQTTPYGITRVGGGATYGEDKVVWVIDTGIDLDHPDLNVDDSRGAYFTGRGTKSPDDDNGHGTHVAGTIAAVDNGEGVIGVAAGATVIPVKVLDRSGSGSLSGVIDGIDFVATNASPGDVANMSLGGGVSPSLDDAVKNASNEGIYFSLAAGNESDDANNHSPARVNGDYIYTISAMDDQDNFASFSNYGNPPVDFCEPGVNIISTYKDGGYATASGTSMAAPHMAGILLWGTPDTDGAVNDDPDGEADAIGVVAGGNSGGDGGDSNNPPSASFTYSATDLTVDFTDTSTDSDGSIASWSWDFDDGNTTNTQNPTHTYAADGTYTITLTVTDDDGATDTASEGITVSGSSENVAPMVTDLSLSDAGNPAWTRASVSWTVSDDNGNLQTVVTELYDPSDNLVDSATTSVSGSSASGTNELGQKGGPNGDYKVVITVTDSDGLVATAEDTIEL